MSFCGSRLVTSVVLLIFVHTWACKLVNVSTEVSLIRGTGDAIDKMWHLLQNQTVALTNYPAMKKEELANRPSEANGDGGFWVLAFVVETLELISFFCNLY